MEPLLCRLGASPRLERALAPRGWMPWIPPPPWRDGECSSPWP